MKVTKAIKESFAESCQEIWEVATNKMAWKYLVVGIAYLFPFIVSAVIVVTLPLKYSFQTGVVLIVFGVFWYKFLTKILDKIEDEVN